MTIIDVVDHYGITRPEQVAFRSEEGSITYWELSQQSRRLAQYLRRRLSPIKNPLAVYGHKSPYMLVCFFAAARLGRPYVPVDRFIPPYRLGPILDEAQAELVLALEEMSGAHP
ncbi:MAG: AMP-binding protein, partial [Oscillospiraceae bacterium]|nr:AMP-binding protein [Oscillospiraceae bacterium]